MVKGVQETQYLMPPPMKNHTLSHLEVDSPYVSEMNTFRELVTFLQLFNGYFALRNIKLCLLLLTFLGFLVIFNIL